MKDLQQQKTTTFSKCKKVFTTLTPVGYFSIRLHFLEQKKDGKQNLSNFFLLPTTMRIFNEKTL